MAKSATSSHLLDLTGGLGGDLARLEGDQRGEGVPVFGQQLGESLDERAADGRRCGAPLEECLLGGGDRLLGTGRVGHDDLGQHAAGERSVRGEPGAEGGRVHTTHTKRFAGAGSEVGGSGQLRGFRGGRGAHIDSLTVVLE